MGCACVVYFDVLRQRLHFGKSMLAIGQMCFIEGNQMTTTAQLSEALRLLEVALRTQTQYTISPNIGCMNAARAAKDEISTELRRLAEGNERQQLLLNRAARAIRGVLEIAQQVGVKPTDITQTILADIESYKRTK